MEIHSVTDKDDVWLHPRRSRPLTSPHFETKPAKTSHLSTSEIQESSHHSHAYEKDDWRSFIEFSWVRSEHLHATHPIDGEQALVYLHPLQDRSTEFLATLHKAPKGELGLPLVEGVIAAAISPGTRLPKMLQVGAEVRVYTFNPLPQQALALPTKVERFVKMLLSPAKFSPRPLP